MVNSANLKIQFLNVCSKRQKEKFLLKSTGDISKIYFRQ